MASLDPAALAALPASFNLAVAGCTGTVAAAVLAANLRRTWNQWLALFLVLVSGNFALQGLIHVHGLWTAAPAAGAWPVPGDPQAWSRLGTLLLLFDPPALAYFASIFPRRTALARESWGLPLLGGTLLVFVAAEVGWGHMSAPTEGGALDAVRIAFFLYLAACYAYAAWRLLANYLEEPSSVMARQARFVALGVLIAAVPRIALVPVDAPVHAVFHGLGVGPDDAAELALRLAALAGLYLAARGVVRAAPVPEARRAEAMATLRLAGWVFLGFGAVWALRVPLVLARAGLPLAPELAAPGQVLDSGLIFTARWFAFSAAIVVGVLRYQVLGVASLRLAGAGAAGALAVGGVGLAAALASPAAAAGAAALGIVAVAGLLRGSGRPGPGPGRGRWLHERGLEVYRATLAAALTAGPLDEARGAELRAQRERLGVSEREHHGLLAIAQAEEATGAPAATLGRWRVLQRLGAGGHATVYLARDGDRGSELVVLKRIREDAAGPRGALDAALRELEVARRVSHPHVVAIHDVVRVDDGALVAMEHCAGGSLRDLLDAEGRMPPERAEALLRQALAGLAALHEAGIVHGDLKPGNLLLTAEGTLKLADFGTARAAGAGQTLVSVTGAGEAPGTLLYMAPERARGARATEAADLYALGAIFHEALAGRPYVSPEGGPMDLLERIVQGPPGGPRPLPGTGPLGPALAAALAADPGARPRSAAAMLEALDAPTPRRGATKGWRGG